MGDSEQQNQGEATRADNGQSGDHVGGDKITVGDITDSIVAIGTHAQVTVTYATPGEVPGLWVGVPPMPPHFVGREDIVQDLAEQLTTGASLALSIEGLPGVGKTTLAVALAHHQKVLEHFKDGVLWAGLGREAKDAEVVSILNRWATALKIDVTDKIDFTERKQAVEDVIGRRALLIVIDDVWDFDVAKLLRFGNPHCRHLLTTRDQTIARQFAGVGHTFSIPTLEEDPSFHLLQELAPEACAAHQETAQALALAVGGLPLALELLGGYLAVPEHSLLPGLSQKALEEMTKPRRRLQLAQERLGAPGRQVTLRETIALSLEGLRELENGEELEQTFYSLGAFAPKPETFSWEAAAAVANVEIEMLASLAARNLVYSTGEQLAMHQILANVAEAKLDEESIARHRDYYLNLVNEDWKDWQRIEKVYGQIKRAWKSLPEDDRLLEWVWALELYQWRRGLRQDELDWAQRGLELAGKSGLHEDEVKLLNKVGLTCTNLGQWNEALEYYNQALAICEKWGDQAGQASTLNNIGLVYNNLGQWSEAVTYYYQALVISEEIDDQARVALALNNIGLVYNTLGQRDKALEYYYQALAILKEEGIRDEEALILNNIGRVYDNLGHPDTALDYYHKALSAYEEIGDQAGQASILNNIGLICDNLGRYEKALEYYNQALSILKEVDDLRLQSTNLNNIGWVYCHQGQWDEALEYYNQSLAILEDVGDQRGKATMLDTIGAAYRHLGQRDEALEYYYQALALWEGIGDRVSQQYTLLMVGRIYLRQGRLRKVAAVLKQWWVSFTVAD